MHMNSSTIKDISVWLSFSHSIFRAQTFKNTFCLHFAAIGDINMEGKQTKICFLGMGGQRNHKNKVFFKYTCLIKLIFRKIMDRIKLDLCSQKKP